MHNNLNQDIQDMRTKWIESVWLLTRESSNLHDYTYKIQSGNIELLLAIASLKMISFDKIYLFKKFYYYSDVQ